MTALIGRAACIAALLVSGVALADPVPSMSLPQALEYARTHRPLVRGALAQLTARRLDARVPRAGWLPQIGATAEIIAGTDNEYTAAYLGAADGAILPRVGATKANAPTWRPEPTTLAALSARQQIYDFGRIAAQDAAADALANEAKADADRVALDVALDVTEAYASVLAAKQVQAASDEQLRRTATQRDFVKAGVDRDLRPPIDLTRASAELSATKARTIRAQGGVADAQAVLAATVGFDGGVLDATELSLDAAQPPALDAALRRALAHNPALQASMMRLSAQQATTRSISRQLLPNLFAAAGLLGAAGGAVSSANTRAYGGGWLPDVQNWYVGVVATWNVFDPVTLARRRASREREEVARADLEETTLQLGAGVRRAWIALGVSVDALPALRETVDSARANMTQAQARLRADLGTIVELADAENTLINAQQELAIGQFAVARARAELGRALGDAAFGAGIGK